MGTAVAYQITGWTLFALLAGTVFGAIVRGRLVPGKTVDRLLEAERQVAAMKQAGWDAASVRADVQQSDLMRAMQALTAALERSKPAGLP